MGSTTFARMKVPPSPHTGGSRVGPAGNRRAASQASANAAGAQIVWRCERTGSLERLSEMHPPGFESRMQTTWGGDWYPKGRPRRGSVIRLGQDARPRQNDSRELLCLRPGSLHRSIDAHGPGWPRDVPQVACLVACRCVTDVRASVPRIAMARAVAGAGCRSCLPGRAPGTQVRWVGPRRVGRRVPCQCRRLIGWAATQ